MANGFNPFFSQDSLLDFVNQLETPSFNEREEQLDNPVSNFRVQQQESGVTPSFTNNPAAKGSLDQMYVGPDSPDPVIAKMYQDNQRSMLGNTLSFDKDWYDLTSIDDEFEAMQRAEKIRQTTTNTARELEKQLATDMGLYDLQKQYTRMLAIPGALDFESTRNRISQMETQIRAKQTRLRQQIENASDGNNYNASGELSDQFNEAYQLARQWDIRAAELQSQRQWEQSGNNPDTIAKRVAATNKAQAISSLGGQEYIDSLAKDLRITPDQVISLQEAGRLEKETIDYNDFYRKNGTKPTVEDAVILGKPGGQFRNLTAQRISAAIPGLNSSQIDSIYKEVEQRVAQDEKRYYNEFYLGKGDFDKADEARKKNFVQYEVADEKLKEEARKYGRRKAINEVMTQVKGKIKESAITPEMYDLELNISVPPEVRNTSKALINLVPDAFRYSPDPEVAKENIRTIAATYQKMKDSSPMALPRFADVMQPMMSQMVDRINGEMSPLDPMILDVSDPAFQQQQQMILRLDANMRNPRAAGAGIMPQLERGVQSLYNTISNALNSAVESSPTAPTPPMGNSRSQPNRTSGSAQQFPGESDVPVDPGIRAGFDVPLPQSGPVTPVGNPDRVFANPYLPVAGQLARGASVPVDVLPPNIREILIRNGVDMNAPIPSEAAVRIIEAEKRSGMSFDPNDPLAGRKLQYLLNAHGASLRITE